jgi:lipopolysaccharide heptosyltransferase III
VRNDGLGDFLLTLPLVAALKRRLPGAHVTVLLSAALAPLVPLLPDIDAALADEGVLLKRHRGRFPPAERRARAAALQAAVRAGGFAAALLPYAEAGTARLVQRAGVPLRVGPLRRAFFWRFNAHYRRSRRGSGAAEVALNLAYLECLGLPADYEAPRLALPAPPPAAPKEPYAVLHPHKRSGTALSWPPERFAELARRLLGAGLAVVAVGDGADRPALAATFAALPAVRVETGLTLPELAALIGHARLFAGNSSGPLHLAALAGTPHVGLYPQDRVSAPERWRTLPVAGAPADFRSYLLAPRFPKDCVVCEGPRCPYHNCVASLPVDSAWAALRAWGLELAPTAGAVPAPGVAGGGDPR